MRLNASLSTIVIFAFIAAGGIWAMWILNPRPKAEVIDSNRSLDVADSMSTSEEVDAPPAITSGTWFTTVTESTGIQFSHDSGSNAEKPFPSANGSGIAALDYDLDGKYDLYFATGTDFPIEQGRTEPVNRCYRNLGAMNFQDVTFQCRLGHNGYSAGLAVGDYDNDGFPDLYVNCFGSNVLYHNAGDGTFAIATASAHVNDNRWGTSAVFFDYDNDGLLDLYVGNYAKWSWESRRWCGDRKRNVRVHCGPHSVEPEEDVLFRNVGDGTFEDATNETGIDARSARTQGIVASDVNRDGYCDLYLGNDLHANSLFINNGSGAFVDTSDESGVAYDYKGSMQAGMGVASADVTGDGFPELFVTNFSNEHNSFYVNTPQGLFQEASQRFGLYAEGFPLVGWGTVFADFDLDGAFDLIVTNGHVDDNRHLFGEGASYTERPLAWRQTGGRFQLLGGEAGSYFVEEHVGRAVVVSDLDNDGDLDTVVGHQDASPAVLRNEHLASNDESESSYSLRLIGTRSNRDAIGAAVTMYWHEQSIVQQVKGGGSYLSSHDQRKIFAVPQGSELPRFEIRWPSGSRSQLDNLQTGATIIIEPPTSPGTGPKVITRR